MKIEKIDSPAAGTWARDCELLYLSQGTGFRIFYHRDEDDTYWVVKFGGVIMGYKVIGEEFSRAGYLINMPIDGAFFEITDSPWMREIGEYETRVTDKCKHYVLRFYDETIEIIGQNIIFEQLKEKPQIPDIQD